MTNARLKIPGMLPSTEGNSNNRKGINSVRSGEPIRNQQTRGSSFRKNPRAHLSFIKKKDFGRKQVSRGLRLPGMWRCRMEFLPTRWNPPSITVRAQSSALRLLPRQIPTAIGIITGQQWSTSGLLLILLLNRLEPDVKRKLSQATLYWKTTSALQEFRHQHQDN